MRASARPASTGEARVLVIDDEEANVRLLERILARGGYQHVRTLTDPREVLAEVGEFRPDLLMLDLHMPHLDGYGVLQQLGPVRDREGYLPVLVLSADVASDAGHRALALGAEDFIAKPFDAEEVLLRTRNLLETRFLYRELRRRNRDLAAEVEERTAELMRAQAAHAEIVGALTRLNAGATAEETARAICIEFGRSPSFDAVVIIAFPGDGTAVPIATGGRLDLAAILNAPASGSRSRRLLERAREGPRAWRVDVTAEHGAYGRALGTSGIRSAWYAPLLAGDRPVGLLVAGSVADLDPGGLERMLPTVVELAAIARPLLVPGLLAQQDAGEARANLRRVVGERHFAPVFQPIVSLVDGRPIGYEALTRFADGERPDVRFAEAHRVGVGHDLELATLTAALEESAGLPAKSFVSLNVSPSLLLEVGRLREVLRNARRLVVIEITEHVAIADYGALRASLEAIGPQVRLAIDDAGAGFASFRHILELRPDFVKLDRDLVHAIEADASRQALVVGMRYFAQKTGCTLISEGVETEAERATLSELGIEFGQGYLFGKPAALAGARTTESSVASLRRAPSAVELTAGGRRRLPRVQDAAG